MSEHRGRWERRLMFPVELGIDVAVYANGPLTLAGLKQLRLMIDLAIKHRTQRKKRGAP